MSVAKRDLEDNRKVTTHRLIEMKQRGEKISMLTAYDYSMAQLIDQAGMDVICWKRSVALQSYWKRFRLLWLHRSLPN